MGAIQLRRKKSRREWDQIKREVDTVLDRFYMARIGLRFLLEHHVTCSPEYRQQGQGGIIQSDCSPLAVAELAAADAKLLCEHHLGDCPDITYQCAPAPPPSAAPTASEQRRRGCWCWVCWQWAHGHPADVRPDALTLHALRGAQELDAGIGRTLPRP